MNDKKTKNYKLKKISKPLDMKPGRRTKEPRKSTTKSKKSHPTILEL